VKYYEGSLMNIRSQW